MKLGLRIAANVNDGDRWETPEFSSFRFMTHRIEDLSMRCRQSVSFVEQHKNEAFLRYVWENQVLANLEVQEDEPMYEPWQHRFFCELLILMILNVITFFVQTDHSLPVFACRTIPIVIAAFICQYEKQKLMRQRRELLI